MIFYGVPSTGNIMKDKDDKIVSPKYVYIKYNNFYVDRYEHFYKLHYNKIESYSGNIDEK